MTITPFGCSFSDIIINFFASVSFVGVIILIIYLLVRDID